jgi:hypothetical protein
MIRGRRAQSFCSSGLFNKQILLKINLSKEKIARLCPIGRCGVSFALFGDRFGW